jgi:hypothetical protein
MLAKFNQFLPTACIVLVLALLLHDRLAPTGPTVNHDPVIVKLGKDYRAALDAVGANPFKAVANGSFDTIEELTAAQQKAVTQSLTDAYTPIAKELESRFGKAEDGKASVNSVKNFFADLSYGYGK